MKLTDITPAEGKRDDILFGPRLIALGIFKDANLPTGFGLRVRRASGDGILRAWIFQYRQHGRGRRMIIGDAHSVTPPQALDKARKLHAEVELGGDPQGDKKERREKDAQILGSLVEDYLEVKTGRPNTLRTLKGFLKTHAKPLHSIPVDKITRKDIAARVLAVKRSSGPTSAAGLRGALSALFSWGMEMGLVHENPVVGSLKIERQPSRDRVLSGDELAAIWNALGDDNFGTIVKLLILTGCRREEIGGMRWSEFDLDKATWALPTERAKNHKALTLPITPLMAEIIASVPRRFGIDCLFGERGVGFSRWSAGRDALNAKISLKPWQLRDIRRSVATGMADIDVPPHIVEVILNHISGHKGGIAGIYNRARYEIAVFNAMMKWSDHVRSLVEGTERKVLVFEQRAPATL
jgi:integrase